MGIVYRAEDTKLARTVALKLLPPHALVSEDDKARFYREARAAAALNHPNIAHVYEIDEAPLSTDGGSGQADGLVETRPFIAMEYIDGETLANHIEKGPLPLKDAISIAKQIAEGLKVAHGANVVHRDIKSGNIMLTSAGVVKILDFGLAKTAASTKLTQMGSTLGTVAYMSPEQARGEEVDPCSDMWSLGVIMYEMVTGRMPFAGDYEQAVVYGILNAEPEPLTALRTGVSMDLESIVSKLLRKDSRHRYQTAADLIADLENIQVGSQTVSRTTVSPSPKVVEPTRTSNLRIAGAFLVGIVLAGLTMYALLSRQGGHENAVLRLEATIPADAEVSSVDISRDGRTLVFSTASLATDNVYVRDMASGQTRLMAGTAGTWVAKLSPDGNSILLTKQLTVERTSIRMGAPLLVVEAEEGTPRANWGPEGWVVYEDQQAIWKVSLNTGEASPLTRRDSLVSESDHDWPILLPDGKTVMATVEYQDGSSTLGFWDFESGERVSTVRNGGYRAQYVPTGHLVYVLNAATSPGDLVAVPFDLGSLQQTGTIIPVATNVTASSVTVSDNGTLVYRQGGMGTVTGFPAAKLVVATFPGNQSALSFPPAVYTSLELSPDGSKAVTAILDPDLSDNNGNGTDVSVLDLVTERSTRLTFDASGRAPTWHPSGDSVYYVDSSMRDVGQHRAMVRAADGSGRAREVFTSTVGVWDLDVSPDGTMATYVVGSSLYGTTGLEVRSLVTGEVTRLTERRNANRRNPIFSPDNVRIAYEEDGQVYVRNVDGSGLPLNFSTGFAWHPVWGRDSEEMYFFCCEGGLYKAIFGRARTVDLMLQLALMRDTYDIFPDGERALLTSPALAAGLEQERQESVRADSTETLVFTINWFQELE
jgi:serine/threonine-protein kinase